MEKGQTPASRRADTRPHQQCSVRRAAKHQDQENQSSVGLSTATTMNLPRAQSPNPGSHFLHGFTVPSSTLLSSPRPVEFFLAKAPENLTFFFQFAVPHYPSFQISTSPIHLQTPVVIIFLRDPSHHIILFLRFTER